MPNVGRQHQFSADRPITSRTEDLLGRTGFAEALAHAIRGWTGRDSLVIALYGPWGSGKSSVKNMVLESLRESPVNCPLIVEFNPWQWAGQDQLAGAFFREVGLTLERVDTTTEGKKRAARWRTYGTYLTLGASLAKSLGTVLPLAGLPISELFNLLAQWLEQSGKITQEGAKGLAAQAEATAQSLVELKRELAAMLAQLERPILVVMDDVDRLSTNEITLLFQLVKANADFPNVIYLLLCQRDIVEKSLEVVAPISGREFLEKIVQVGFDIPRVERTRLERVLFVGLDALLEDKGAEGRFDQQRWGNLFLGGLRPYFETLRDVHRFLATFSFQVALFHRGSSFEVNPVDLIALEVLRDFEPELYHRLPVSKLVLTGQLSRDLHGRVAEEEARRLIESLVDLVHEPRRAQIREILKQLFPPADWAFGGPHYRSGFEERWYRELRVCHPEVFDRYFHFAIPEGDIPQADLDRLLSLIGQREELVATFRALNHRGLLAVALNRLEAYKEHLDLRYAEAFVTALLDVGDDLPERPASFFAISADMHAVRIIHWYLKQEQDCKQRGHILKAAFKATTGIYLPVMKTSLEDSKQEQQRDPETFAVDAEDLQDLREICVAKIREAAASGALKSHPQMVYILYRWSEWTSPEEPREWVGKLVESEEGLLALLTAFLQQSTSHGMGDHVARVYWYISLKSLEDFIPASLLAEKTQQLQLERLNDKERKAIHAFQKALKRREEGRSDDDCTRMTISNAASL